MTFFLWYPTFWEHTHAHCNVPDLDSLGNVANLCVGSKVYNI
jgi:hypothetical protein